MVLSSTTGFWGRGGGGERGWVYGCIILNKESGQRILFRKFVRWGWVDLHWGKKLGSIFAILQGGFSFLLMCGISNRTTIYL